MSFKHKFTYEEKVKILMEYVNGVNGFRETCRIYKNTFDLARELYPNAEPIFHSDRGFQYTSKVFKKKLDDAGMIQSMSNYLQRK